jgi:WD40 repeat protein
MFSCLRSFIFLGPLESFVIFNMLQVSTHGCSDNHILVWKYPSMTQVANLTGHSSRVLYLAVSPDGEAIVTGAGDETLRFWNVFSKGRSQKVSAQFSQ